MKNNYLIFIFAFLISIVFQTTGIANVIASGPVNRDSTKTLHLKDSRPNRPKFDVNILNKDFESFMKKVSAVKATSSTAKVSNSTEKKSVALDNQSQKPIDNVKIYPNPVVSTQISLSYTLAKDNMVTIKILDVLGNEVATLLSQKVNAGEQSNTFNLTTKLNSGLYFVRIITGSESIIKRISVL